MIARANRNVLLVPEKADCRGELAGGRLISDDICIELDGVQTRRRIL
jgi:hypothetical protein